jgi:hypothetical protein
MDYVLLYSRVPLLQENLANYLQDVRARLLHTAYWDPIGTSFTYLNIAKILLGKAMVTFWYLKTCTPSTPSSKYSIVFPLFRINGD